MISEQGRAAAIRAQGVEDQLAPLPPDPRVGRIRLGQNRKAIMSNRETPMTRWYWKQVGGTLVEEFRAVKRTETCSQRLIDGVILPDGPHEIATRRDVELEGQDIIVVQTKRGRLGMYLMGQALFSADLMRQFNPRSIRSVALREDHDSVLSPLLEKHGIEIVIYPGDDTD